MDEEVAKTLAELEFKLAELERELTAMGRRRQWAGESVGSRIDRVDTQTQPVEQRQSVEREWPPGRPSIELAELVRFREKLRTTLDGLIDEYTRLLSLGPPLPPRSDV